LSLTTERYIDLLKAFGANFVACTTMLRSMETYPDMLKRMGLANVDGIESDETYEKNFRDVLTGAMAICRDSAP